ncbi:MAG: Riboflavin synthase [Syntrophaceae bacterium PtaB.Bin095]|nr:MAG: Riboflavin synthase [Syntrophaceae bacterium PtaB.Bin095]
MFTGIIEAMGSVGRVTRKGADALLGIETAMDLQEVRVGDSIAVNGACLTVTARGDRGFTADVSAETLERTNLRMLKTGDRVNLEKAMRLNDFLGGHLVLGHVDGLGRVQEITRKANSLIFGIETDAKLLRYVVEKGSVAVDGISLTVNRCEKKRFYVNLIPHTARMTTLGFVKIGDFANIETDIIGKYVERLLQPRGGMDRDFLAEHGFLK